MTALKYRDPVTDTWIYIPTAGPTGPAGPTGAQGIQGIQGPPGTPGAATSGHASFTFNAATTEPPTGNQMRINNASQTAATRLWVAQTSTDGLDVSVGLAKVLAGHQIYVQDFDDASKWVKYSVTADGVDDGSYYDFTVVYHSGPANVPFQTVEFMPIAPGTVGVPPGGTTGQALTKTSAVDFAVGWTSVQPVDPELTAIAGLTSAADKLPYFTGSGSASVADFTAPARALLDDTSTTVMRATLGVVAIAVKATQPVAADYGEATIPIDAIWIQKA